MELKVAFRVDASTTIGSGHLFRCLTLADALRNKGIECYFICRDNLGGFIKLIVVNNFRYFVLKSKQSKSDFRRSDLMHAHFLDGSWENDVSDCIEVLNFLRPHALVVDHYALDYRWESAVNDICKIIVIDDLADRRHMCSALIDQTLCHSAEDYKDLVPCSCNLLLGPAYAILRPDFQRLRNYSLGRRSRPALNNILITMGGVDLADNTTKVLEGLESAGIQSDCHVTVIVGASSPWLSRINKVSSAMPFAVTVRSNVGDMAAVMADADLAISAGGSTVWELCCLGVATALIIVAENQVENSKKLADLGAVRILDPSEGFCGQIQGIIRDFSHGSDKIQRLINACSEITEGKGRNIISELILDIVSKGSLMSSGVLYK